LKVILAFLSNNELGGKLAIAYKKDCYWFGIVGQVVEVEVGRVGILTKDF
jgi:hypothetical protein